MSNSLAAFLTYSSKGSTSWWESAVAVESRPSTILEYSVRRSLSHCLLRQVLAGFIRLAIDTQWSVKWHGKATVSNLLVLSLPLIVKVSYSSWQVQPPSQSLYKRASVCYHGPPSTPCDWSSQCHVFGMRPGDDRGLWMNPRFINLK